MNIFSTVNFFSIFFLYGEEYSSGEVRNCKYSKKSNGYIYFFSCFTAFETQLASFFFFYVGKLFIPSWIFLVSLKGYKKIQFPFVSEYISLEIVHVLVINTFS